MEEQAILCLGAFTLLGSGAGLIGLYSGNPRLKGLNLMGSAIFVGGVAAGTLLGGTLVRVLQPFGLLLVVVAFSLIHDALRILGDETSVKNRTFYWPLAAQAVVSFLQAASLLSARWGLVLFSLALALEMASIATLVRSRFILEENAPARFTVGLFWFLITADLLRGAIAAAGFLQDVRLNYWTETITYGLLIAAGVGLGFGFFSMTTLSLTAKLDKLANTDPLTRLFNRRVFQESCEQEFERSKRLGLSFSMLLLDLDHFKHFNDSFGHQAGDEALCAASRAIQNAVRGIDVVSRWGGEEFAVLLPNASSAAALIVANRICGNIRAVSTASTKAQWKYGRLTVSIGAVTFDGTQAAVGTMFGDADAALYAAKRAGRDQVIAAQ